MQAAAIRAVLSAKNLVSAALPRRSDDLPEI
jgi:hypothetical protein